MRKFTELRTDEDIESFCNETKERFLRNYVPNSSVIREISELSGMATTSLWRKMHDKEGSMKIMLHLDDAVKINAAMDKLNLK